MQAWAKQLLRLWMAEPGKQRVIQFCAWSCKKPIKISHLPCTQMSEIIYKCAFKSISHLKLPRKYAYFKVIQKLYILDLYCQPRDFQNKAAKIIMQFQSFVLCCKGFLM